MTKLEVVYSDEVWRVARIKADPPWFVNTWIVVAVPESAAIIVDPAISTDEIDHVLSALGARPIGIMLTHGHHDHVVHLADATDRYDLDALVGDEDRRLVRQAAMFGIRFAGRVIRTPKRVSGLSGDTLPVGSTALRIVAAPGHTPGSVVIEAGGFAITGDTLLRERVGRTDLPGGDAQIMRETIDRLLASWGDDTLLCAGHGETWTAGRARAWWSQHAGRPPAPVDLEP